MGTSRVRDLIVGLFVLGGIGALGYLSLSVGGLSYAGPGGLTLHATFAEIAGLSPRAPVVIGGVKIGTVTSIELDADYYARVTIDVDATLRLPDDSSAAILTQGLLGNQYIGIELGASEDMLEVGDEFETAHDAFIMERVIGRMMDNLAGS